jgi:hypothetical protein
MTDQTRFKAHLAAACQIVPGGRLNRDDKAGLIRRGIAEGLTETEAQQTVEALHLRPRHPITSIGE